MKDDRGPADLTKQIEDLKLTITMYQTILRDAQKQIYYWKTFGTKVKAKKTYCKVIKK